MKPVARFGTFLWRIPMVFASALVIAGCESKEKNVIIDQQPGGITIQHDSRYGSMAAIEADEHCAKYGKTAVFDRTIRPDDETLLVHPEAAQSVFDCVDPKAAK